MDTVLSTGKTAKKMFTESVTAAQLFLKTAIFDQIIILKIFFQVRVWAVLRSFDIPIFYYDLSMKYQPVFNQFKFAT